MTPEELIVICLKAFNNPEWQPRKDRPENEAATFCNLAVTWIAGNFGYSGFFGMLANDMINLMERSAKWAKTDLPMAQKLANDGRLVIVGAKDSPHGHVCVVRPGEMAFSGKWKCRVPIVVNIGAKNSWDKTANFIFTSMPRAWVLI